jgi:hypothetical protein
MRGMAHDPEVADRLRQLVSGVENLTEQRMFGGLAFLVNGNMAVAAGSGGGLLVRVDPDQAGAWIDGDRVTPMVMRGREMRGWLRVATDAAAPDLDQWAARGVAHARSLPAKTTS